MYDKNKLIRMGAFEAFAEKAVETFATKEALEALSSSGEANVIETVKVNGTALPVTDKAVNVAVPVKVSELSNDSGFQTAEQVAAAVAAGGTASFEEAESVPDAGSAKDNVLYLVKNGETYDIYAKVGSEVRKLGSTTVDLSDKLSKSDIATDEEVTEMLDAVFAA